MQIDLSKRGLETFDPSEFEDSDSDRALLLHITHIDLSYNALYTTSGLMALQQLTTLNLSHNGLKALQGGLPPTLVRLDLSHNGLTTLRSGALLSLPNLESLDLSHNQLQDLRGVPDDCSPSFRVLNVNNNQLGSLMGLERSRSLEELNAGCNLIRDAASLSALQSLTRLQALILEENPVLLRKRQAQILRGWLPHVDLAVPSGITSANTSMCSIVAGSSVKSDAAIPRGGTTATVSRSVSNASALPPPPPPLPQRPQSVSPRSSKDGGVGSGEDTPVSKPREPLPTGRVPTCLSTNLTAGTDISQAAERTERQTTVGHPYYHHDDDTTKNGRKPMDIAGARDNDYQRLLDERNAYRQRVADLEKMVKTLQDNLTKQQESTAVVLCLNAQLQKRLMAASSHQQQQGKSNNNSGQETLTVEGSGKCMPPLAPPRAGISVLQQRQHPNSHTHCADMLLKGGTTNDVGTCSRGKENDDCNSLGDSSTVLVDVSAETTSTTQPTHHQQRPQSEMIMNHDRRRVAEALMAKLRTFSQRY